MDASTCVLINSFKAKKKKKPSYNLTAVFDAFVAHCAKTFCSRNV